MVNSDELLIVIDAGHGGWDNGASWMGRLEKDDNLRLALAVQKELEAQGVSVLMTRDTDVYVSLSDRVDMANNADADLFVSLHRNSYIEQTPMTNGVENFIYLSAPLETTGRAAQYVLDRVVDVGVQSNRGVSRGNYYVLRRTIMPAMLLEMGFIINEIDNELFDEHLEEYAAAIAKGIMQYFSLEYHELPEFGKEPPLCPPCPVCPNTEILKAQMIINDRFALNMPLSGFFDEATKRAMVMALQKALNMDFNARLLVDGILGPKTLAAFPTVAFGQRGNVVLVLQALLQLNGYNTGGLDGMFGAMTRTAAQMFQRDRFLVPDGVINQTTLKALLGSPITFPK